MSSNFLYEFQSANSTVEFLLKQTHIIIIINQLVVSIFALASVHYLAKNAKLKKKNSYFK